MLAFVFAVLWGLSKYNTDRISGRIPAEIEGFDDSDLMAKVMSCHEQVGPKGRRDISRNSYCADIELGSEIYKIGERLDSLIKVLQRN